MQSCQKNFKDELEQFKKKVNDILDSLLSQKSYFIHDKRPEALLKAMRYAVLGSGKCLRSFLVMQTTLLMGGDQKAALLVGAAVECVHCYSLVHDDLPAMDNDAMRRGKPTVYRAFDEATAILAGDSLLTLAFEILSDSSLVEIAPACRVELILSLARASGVNGMAGGQALDLEASNKELNEQDILQLQLMKTSALFGFSAEAGAILSGSDSIDRNRLRQFGTMIGSAFQMADDILDATSSLEKIGKATKKDDAAGKKTFLSLYGIEKTKIKMINRTKEAKSLLDSYGDKALVIKEMADFFIKRTS